jgi:hypothetical protein
MNTNLWKNKTIERQKLLRLLSIKAANIPKTSLNHNRNWFECCTELREIEIALDRAGLMT